MKNWNEALVYAKNNQIDLFIDLNRYGKRFYKCNYKRDYKTFSDSKKGLNEFKKFINLEDFHYENI